VRPRVNSSGCAILDNPSRVETTHRANQIPGVMRIEPVLRVVSTDKICVGTSKICVGTIHSGHFGDFPNSIFRLRPPDMVANSSARRSHVSVWVGRRTMRIDSQAWWALNTSFGSSAPTESGWAPKQSVWAPTRSVWLGRPLTP